MKNYQSLTDALADLKTKGYEADFYPDTDCLYCEDLDIRLDPDDFHIDEVYRFEDDSSPGKNSALYAITSTTGVKGTLLDVHDAYPTPVN